jgi:hypothetical protein
LVQGYQVSMQSARLNRSVRITITLVLKVLFLCVCVCVCVCVYGTEGGTQGLHRLSIHSTTGLYPQHSSSYYLPSTWYTPGTFPSTLHVLWHFILVITPGDRNCYYLYFTDGEIGALNHLLMVMQKRSEQGLEPGFWLLSQSFRAPPHDLLFTQAYQLPGLSQGPYVQCLPCSPQQFLEVGTTVILT